MTLFTRIVAAIFWLLLLVVVTTVAAAPVWSLTWLQDWSASAMEQLQRWQTMSPANFIIIQATVGILAITSFGILFWWTAFAGQQRGVRIRTPDGGSAELDVNSISQRLEWHLAQVAEVNNVVPLVKARGGAVDIRLEVEVLPSVDIPLKTDEVVVVTRDVIEDMIGLTLGKLDVHLRCAPLEPSLA